jgi:quinone-modifying oxidoreductase subunit QmoC
LSHHMDYTPRQIVAMIRAGFKSEVLTSYTMWLCASCYACTVECPKEIKITDVMYAAKRMAIREGIYPKRFPIPVLASEFFKSVEHSGRNSEAWLLMRLYMRTNPFAAFKQAGLGLRLWLRGRLGLKREAIERKDELRMILQTLEKERIVSVRGETAPAEEVTA